MSSWGQAVNNNIGFGHQSEAIERTLSNGDVRITESGDFRVVENSGKEGYASIYTNTWSGQTDLIKEG